MAFELPPTRITDPSFLEGLRVVLEPYYDQSPLPTDQIDAVVKRAEAFFLSTRQDVPPFATQPAPLASLSNTTPPPPPSSSTTQQAEQQPPYPTSFAHLASLISTGATIPGIRDIPDLLASDEPSESTLAAKEGGGRKPWEKRLGGETAGEVGVETRPEGEAEGEAERTMERCVREEEAKRAEQ